MSRVYRPRDVRFRVTCGVSDLEAQARVVKLLTARSIVPDACVASGISEDQVELDILVRDTLGVQAIRLARIFEGLAGVDGIELEIDGRAVDFRDAREVA